MVRLSGVGQRLLQQQRAAPLGCPTAGDGTRAAAWDDGRVRTVVRGWWKKRVLVGETFGLAQKPVCQAGA